MYTTKGQIRLISLLFLLLSLLFVSVFAFSGGDGSVDNPFNISTCAQLQNMSSNLNANYQLVSDIDCSVISNFKPVGNCTGSCGLGENPFTGNFSGNGNSISDLTIVNTSGTLNDGWGLFGYTINAQIYNVTLVNVLINVSDNSVGGLIGESLSSSVFSSFSSGYVTGTNEVGGLVGYSSASSSVFSSFSSVSVNGTNYVGGLVGYLLSSSVFSSFSSGSVNGNLGAGGLVGSSGLSSVSNSSSSGSVTGNIFVGGFFGIFSSNSSVFNSYSSGSVTGNAGVGGLIGGFSSSSSVFNSYSSGSVDGTTQLGGLVGFFSLNSSISNSFTTSQVTGVDTLRTGSFIGVDDGSNTITNSYWNNISGNPTNSVGNGTDTGINPIQDDLTYFYDPSNPPFIGNWDSNVWNFTGTHLPSLIGVSPIVNAVTVTPTTPSSLFPLGSIYIPLSLIMVYFII
jgi:hypothetical protein